MAETTKNITITCAHCSGMYTINIPTSGHGSRGYQHSPGCGKSTQVEVKDGNIIRTKK